jgi:hypothetical protein
MSTGEKNWTRKLKYPLALNRVMPLNDTVYIIPSRGVHTINVKTGEGWDYFSNLGLSDYQKQMSSDVSADEFYSITSIKRRRYPLSDFESNVLVDKDDVFYISKYELAKFNNQGLMKWKVPLPKETGKMFNFIYKSNIYLINTGERTYKAGKLTPENPFISAYDKENGTQKFYSDLYTKEEYIIDFNVIDDSLKLTFPNKICWFSLKKAIIVKTIEYEKDKIGSFATSINPDQIFIQSSDSALHTLIDLYPKAYFFKNWDNQVVILDSNHQLITLINPEDQYILIHENDKANFLYYNNELTVTDKKNRKIGKLDIFSSQIYFLNNHAYEIVRNMIIETDLEQYYNSIY